MHRIQPVRTIRSKLHFSSVWNGTFVRSIPVGEWGSKYVIANWRLPHCWLLVLVRSVSSGMLSEANQEMLKGRLEMIGLCVANSLANRLKFGLVQ
jgi:hypothetical protein